MNVSVVHADDGSLVGGITMLMNREAYEMHSYYDAVRDLTFPTEFVGFSVDEARAWRQRYAGKPWTTEEEAACRALETRLSDAITRVGGTNGAFVRLSTRSPKDAPSLLDRADIVCALRRHLACIVLEFPDAAPPVARNTPLQVLALRRAWFDLMRVHTGSEALALCSLSSRVISDMRRSLDHIDQVPWHMCFIVREFVPLPLEHELRGFVYQQRLVAVSQYATDLFVPKLVSRRAEVATLVRTFFEAEIRERLPAISDYVVDLVLLGSNLEVVRLLELNPYTSQTGGALFDWTNDADVLHGRREFELRLVEEAPRAEGVLLQGADLIAEALVGALGADETASTALVAGGNVCVVM